MSTVDADPRPAAHQFFVCFERGAPPVPWDPWDPGDLPRADCSSVGAVVRSFAERWTGQALTFYVTQDPRWLPTVGDDVACLLSDEWFRRPTYSGAVLAVLRQMSGRPWLRVDSLWPVDTLSLATLANHVRIPVSRYRFHRRAEADAARNGWPSPRAGKLVEIPLGHHKQPELPMTSFSDGLDGVLDGLFADPQRMQRLHEASLEWWRSVCSGEAVGRVLAQHLTASG